MYMANPTREQAIHTISTAFAQFRALMIHNQMESPPCSFPELTKLLQDHVLVSECHLKDFLREPQERC